MKAIITKTVNTIQVSAKKGQTFEIVKETEKSFKILVDGKERMISKEFAKIDQPAKPKVKTGVISEIVNLLSVGYFSKKSILEKLQDLFPERQTASMWNTINCQFSESKEGTLRIEREQKIKVFVDKSNEEKLFRIL